LGLIRRRRFSAANSTGVVRRANVLRSSLGLGSKTRSAPLPLRFWVGFRTICASRHTNGKFVPNGSCRHAATGVRLDPEIRKSSLGRPQMREALYLLILIVVAWGLDHMFFNGHYGRTLFAQAKYEMAQWMN
jgi:hypothetical protein